MAQRHLAALNRVNCAAKGVLGTSDARGESFERVQTPAPQSDAFPEGLLPGSYPEPTNGQRSPFLGEKSLIGAGGGHYRILQTLYKSAELPAGSACDAATAPGRSSEPSGRPLEPLRAKCFWILLRHEGHLCTTASARDHDRRHRNTQARWPSDPYIRNDPKGGRRTIAGLVDVRGRGRPRI
jgi:hypothetical protein